MYGNINRIQNQVKRVPGFPGELYIRSTLYLLSSSVVLKHLKQVSIKSDHEVCFSRWYLMVIGKSGKFKED